MRVDWIFIVSWLCATGHTFDTQEILSSLDLSGNSYQCESGVKPSIVCDNASSDRHNCSCTCTNGITFDQPLDPFSSSTNGAPDDSICQAEKTGCFEREQQLKDENASLTKAQQDLTEREQALKNQLTAYQNKPAYTYQGCFTDSAERVLNKKQVSEPAMTVQRCESICTGYKYYGLQFSTYCFCGQSFAQPTQHKGEEECSSVCPGNKAQKCGGGYRNSLYSRNA
ncbi:unnamed protein product [Alternaria alternata]